MPYLGQSPSNCTGLLRPEVKWEVFLVLVEEAELSALVGIDDCEDARDCLSDVMAIGVGD